MVIGANTGSMHTRLKLPEKVSNVGHLVARCFPRQLNFSDCTPGFAMAGVNLRKPVPTRTSGQQRGSGGRCNQANYVYLPLGTDLSATHPYVAPKHRPTLREYVQAYTERRITPRYGERIMRAGRMEIGIGLISPTGICTCRNVGRHRVLQLRWVTLRNVIQLAEEG